MDKKTISVDDLLSQQNGLQPGFRATVKTDSDDRVKVTPVTAGLGCTCPYAVTVDKAAIEGVVPTGDTHDCCGERLLVVEVAFVNDTVADIFRQLSEASARASKNQSLTTPVPPNSLGRPSRRFPRGARPRVRLHEDTFSCDKCLDDYEDRLWQCYNSALSPEDQSRCIERADNYLKECWIRCGSYPTFDPYAP